MVSAFFFSKDGEVVISSYGRGLWRFRYECPDLIFEAPPYYELEWPILWRKDILTPVARAEFIDTCNECGSFVVDGGTIRDIRIEEKTGEITEIVIDGGQLVGTHLNGEPMQVPFEVIQGGQGSRFIESNEGLAQLLDKNPDIGIKGIYVKDRTYGGVILDKKETFPQVLPSLTEHPAGLRAVAPGDLGIPLTDNGRMDVVARGLDPQYEVEVRIDGLPIDADTPTYFDDKGRFHILVAPMYDIGVHTVSLKQETEIGVFEDVIDFRFTVQDEEEKDN